MCRFWRTDILRFDEEWFDGESVFWIHFSCAVVVDLVLKISRNWKTEEDRWSSCESRRLRNVVRPVCPLLMNFA